MSRWNEQFQNHAFLTTLISLKSLLQDKELETSNNEIAIKEIGRLNKAVNYISAVVEQIDPELILLTLLDTLNQYAAACIAQFKRSSKETKMLDN